MLALVCAVDQKHVYLRTKSIFAVCVRSLALSCVGVHRAHIHMYARPVVHLGEGAVLPRRCCCCWVSSWVQSSVNSGSRVRHSAEYWTSWYTQNMVLVAFEVRHSGVANVVAIHLSGANKFLASALQSTAPKIHARFKSTRIHRFWENNEWWNTRIICFCILKYLINLFWLYLI